jgi:4-diphosphocytidyl-2-C-methyl-D-erythritol kinase
MSGAFSKLNTEGQGAGGGQSPLTLHAPAKINLSLRVLAKRPDGYHEIESLFCPIGLYDRLTLSPCESIQIRCDAAHVPSDSSNLAHRAATVFLDALQKTERRQAPGGIHIELCKQIPVGAGLGGGSSDAAAVLKGLNQIQGHPFNNDQLRAMALPLGADVPFFIDARAAVATGIGEALRPFPNLPNYYVIVIYPGLHIATAEVYKKLNLRLTKTQNKINYFHFTGPQFDVCTHLVNDLETVTENAHPEILEAKSLLRQKGALGTLMSGSGSSVFGLFAVEQEARRALAGMPIRDEWQFFMAPLLV